MWLHKTNILSILEINTLSDVSVVVTKEAICVDMISENRQSNWKETSKEIEGRIILFPRVIDNGW